MKAGGTEKAIQVAAAAEDSYRPRGFLITSDKESCRECWGCVRYCPARAIRVVHGRSEVIEERCVKCGACVVECGNAAHGVRDDTPAVTALLASGRPVVAVLASEFIAAMHPMSSQEVERSLESIGFFGVESTCLGEEMVALEYERNHSR
ncbi:MAG: 4Fe-4S dicluster domain-containing protein, partial [Coriobacteriia bacterium]|nr:4Fe-4S dicluster domain-containing protein [Coriobacteriia bacterium]